MSTTNTVFPPSVQTPLKATARVGGPGAEQEEEEEEEIKKYLECVKHLRGSQGLVTGHCRTMGVLVAGTRLTMSPPPHLPSGPPTKTPSEHSNSAHRTQDP